MATKNDPHYWRRQSTKSGVKTAKYRCSPSTNKCRLQCPYINHDTSTTTKLKVTNEPTSRKGAKSNPRHTIDANHPLAFLQKYKLHSCQKFIFLSLAILTICCLHHDLFTLPAHAQQPHGVRFVNRPTPLQAIVPTKAPPGTVIYKLQARSENPTSGHNNIRYMLALDRANGRFDVDIRTGEVRTKGNEPFTLDKEYTIYVRAEDHSRYVGGGQNSYPSTPETMLSIVGGRRPPQFYMEKYSTSIREDTKRDSDVIEVKANSFSDREIRYTLQVKGRGTGTFIIEPTTGKIKLAKELDYEDPRQPKTYTLRVNASEDSGGFTSFTEVTIGVIDVNDNAPRFELPDYQVHGILEDVKINTIIKQITATDADSGKNAEIEYSIDRAEFSIDSRGNIITSRRLDADVNNTYILTVKATDRGNPPLSGTAVVRVSTENTNDEAPKFSQDVYTPNVDENAGPRTLVTTVVASDRDGDNVIFGFASPKNPLFQIDERTGVIRLSDKAVKLDRDKYELNVTAKDDGKCCDKGNNIIHTSTALVVVFITDVNDQKPTFEDCANYNPMVKENSPFLTPVTTVKAIDNDKGHNGQVRYSIVQQHNQKGTKFIIDEITGEIKTNKVFDREGEDGRFVSVTVKAVDRGTPPLEGVCSFKVEITDVNDNPPLFDRQEYHENVRQDMAIGSHILRVSASDEDVDLNGAISYHLAPHTRRADLDFFSVNQETGWISLKRALENERYAFKALARDQAPPYHNASVDVVLDVVDRANSPPQWDQQVYTKRVRENADISSKIITIKASSGMKDNNNLFYTVIKGSTEQTNKMTTFFLTTRNEGPHVVADIILNYPLDYEKITYYNLTVRAENDGVQQLASECSLNIEVEDVNDEIPLFVEREQQTVLESMPPGTRVTQVQAIDKDGTSPNNIVYYQIESHDGAERNFTIDRNTGEIFTKVEFDREEKQNYALVIRAIDGAPSDRPGFGNAPNSVTTKIRIGIGDKNDNSPYFESLLFEAEVNEDEDIGHVLITVSAKDKDESSKLRYEIVKGNIGGGAFAVNNETGAIYVAGPLDYELRKEYKLVLVASDNLNENYTNVIIKVKDVNDNPPIFDRPTYQTTITEGDDKKLPKKILQVSATDGDRDRPQNIVYFLADQGQDKSEKFFSINSQTGEIFVEKPLDRDAPHGRPVWRFTVYAEDEGGRNGLVGYADVVVNLKDINDNQPYFPNTIYHGNVSERGAADVPVMTIQAVDYDDPNEGRNAKLTYAIQQNAVSALDHGELIFRIDEDTGVIYTAVANLDRETNPEYTLKVLATDGGGKEGYAQAVIRVKDVNDQPPTFTKQDWFVEVDETLESKIPETPILIVQVNDLDSLESNRFTYRVLSGYGSDRFTMVTNADGTGSLKIAKPLDFEDPDQKYGFNITIEVNDGGDIANVKHTDEAIIKIRLRDINDNPPAFENPLIEVSVPESAPKGTVLADFNATDPDQGGKSKVRFSIDRSTNKRKQFAIDPETGVVSIQRPLDREEQARMLVKILATDDGIPQRTATATLTVVLEDVNDNPPKFLRDYVTIVTENTPPGRIEEIHAADLDDRQAGNGPPFFFRLDPNADPSIKEKFEVVHEPGHDGSAHILTKQYLDREAQKEYQVPIIIRDSGNPPLSGTSYLTVVVGDVNDNKMLPGGKTIFVYNYRGQYRNIPIGRVHVEDPDDWDLLDKRFSWDSNTPHPNFSLDQTNGTIFMKNVLEGSYLLRFIVNDHKFTQEVTANVTVVVKNLPDEAVYNSGSIRLAGITDEDFIRVWNPKTFTQSKSKYDLLRETLSNILKEDTSNIDIFSVVTHYKGRVPETDVRFSAHGSPYHKSTFLNGYVAINRRALEKALSVNITMVGIDECMNEANPCDGSCSNSLRVEPYPHVVNANRTSLVGVYTRVVAECECAARRLDEIDGCNSQPPFCLNGGKCTMQNRIATCECPPGFAGPQCQTTARTFGGKGWAWFPPLEQCENSHLSLEFMTDASGGLIFYNGPVDAPETGVMISQDFISLELVKGQPRLLVDFGSGTSEVVVNTLRELNDGEWHHVDIFWTREDIRMVIDFCRDARFDEDNERPANNRTMCEQKASIKQFNEFLNVNSPLQIGGVFHRKIEMFFPQWRHHHTRDGFKGCVRNFVHNSRVYDLGSPGGSLDSVGGCTVSEERCQTNSLNSCEHGQCIGSYKSAYCSCDPGYTGPSCELETQVKNFQQSSFMRYALSFDPNPYITDIQLRFRTRQKNAELIRITGKNTREYCILEIKDRRLRFRYHLNQVHSTREFDLSLPDYVVNDGVWHTVRVVRHGSTATIEADGGGGKKFNEITDYMDLHQLLVVGKQSIVVGGDVNHMGPAAYYVENGLHDSCVTDIRIDQRHLPMENGSENAAVTESRNVIDGCVSTSNCAKAPNTCAPPFVCTDLWNHHECTCPTGWTATDEGGCTDDDECLSEPCNNAGHCINLDNGQGFLCLCQTGYTGDICHLPVQEKMISVAKTAYWVIAFIFLNVIVLILVMFLMMRRGTNDHKYGTGDPDDDVRENIISYDDEGGGEDDMHAFDITPLRIPVDSSGTMISSRSKQNIFNKPGILKDLRKGTAYDGDGSYGVDMTAGEHFIDPGVRLIDGDDRDAASRALDDLRNYAYEGCGSTAGSLSSLASIGRNDDETQDFHYLGRLGPRFQNLANLYSHNEANEHPQNPDQ
uniref:Neural-cadherin n=1 Tax=Aceria tosichella TaxID=561515 RepID=A0A6G1SIF4_9ACAR